MSRKPTYKELEGRIKELGSKISRSEQVEEQLRVALIKYKTLFDAFPLGITVTDEAGKVLEANSIAEKLLGVPQNEHTRRDIDSPEWRIVRLDETPMPSEEYASVRALKERRRVENVEMGIVKHDGEITWISVTAAPLPLEGHGVVISYGDITERKKAEEALRESEAKYRAVVEDQTELICRYHPGGTLTFVNGAYCRYFGRERADLVGRKFFPLIPEEDWQIISEMQALISKENPVFSHEHRVMLLDGQIRWQQWSNRGIFDAQGCLLEIQAVGRDITKRKQTEAALREANLVVEKSPVVIFRWKAAEGWPVDMVSQNVSQFGYAPEELLCGAVPYASMVHPEDLDRVAREVQEHSARGADHFQQEYRIVAKDGRVRWVDDHTSVERNNDGEIVFYQGVVIDITERKQTEEERSRLEDQLKQAQKMQAIGTLAGGIAHDFNNLLMGIQGRASLMLMEMDSSNPHFEHLSGIEEYVRSAADLTKQLLGFARGGKYEVKVTDLNGLVDRSANLFGRTKKELGIHREFQPELWKVEVDRRQIEQVLINLFVNAWQAMPAGGELYLQTENVELDEGSAKPHGVRPGKYVKVSVTDTGVGMDEATKERIFDPFFTTKEMGRGTGLGLASAYGIIKNHEGIITVDSERSQGSTFAMYLPASDKVLSEEKESAGGLVKGEGTILLVDDEEMILEVGKPLLERLGYRVLIARSGKEAMEAYLRNTGLIRMVILDMVMPQMSGAETFAQLKAINPNVKVLLSSGYSLDGRAREILARGCDGFIQKPFIYADLSRKLRKVLDRR